MPEFSDLVRQRLATVPAGDHPDADTLNAYAEKLLPTAERNQILDHLAACSECRDVITLSLETSPVPELAPAVVTAPAVVPRRRIPWLGLATASASSIAALALVTVLIVKQPRTGHSPAPASPVQANDQTAKVAEPAGGANSPVAGLVSPAPETAGRLAPSTGISTAPLPLHSGARLAPRSDNLPFLDRPVQQEPPVVISSNNSTVDAIAASVTSSRRRDYVNDNLFAAGQNQNVPTVNEIPSSPGAGASSQLASGGFLNNNQITSFADLPQQTSTNKPLQSWTFQNSPSHRVPSLVGDLKKGVTELLHKRSPMSAGGLSFSTMGGPAQFNPSSDKSQNVEVAAAAPPVDTGINELEQSSALTHRAMTPKAMASLDTRPQTNWQVGNGNLYRTSETGAWISGYSGSDIEFSFVSFHGSDVWAGGKHAVVVHSSDGGSTWERMHLGEGAAGTVSSITAIGPDIRVATSENQTWSSQDGGKTWSQN